jgi:hypothetical protein
MLRDPVVLVFFGMVKIVQDSPTLDIQPNTYGCLSEHNHCLQETRQEHVKVIVTQPRRIAAISLAKRVASMRGENVGHSVGYRVGHGDHQDSANSVVTFVTVGYLLQYLSHNPELIRRYTHIGELCT